jgi:DNA-binding NtrC family response regulator
MSERITVLLVHHNSATLRTLKADLERQGVRVLHAGSCAQAKLRLGGLKSPPLVFTDAELPDGTWADVLALAEKALLPVSVIVVAPAVDRRLYVEAIECGAFDFVAPPFNPTDLAYVLRCAWDHVMARRNASPRAVHVVDLESSARALPSSTALA